MKTHSSGLFWDKAPTAATDLRYGRQKGHNTRHFVVNGKIIGFPHGVPSTSLPHNYRGARCRVSTVEVDGADEKANPYHHNQVICHGLDHTRSYLLETAAEHCMRVTKIYILKAACFLQPSLKIPTTMNMDALNCASESTVRAILFALCADRSVRSNALKMLDQLQPTAKLAARTPEYTQLKAKRKADVDLAICVQCDEPFSEEHNVSQACGYHTGM